MSNIVLSLTVVPDRLAVCRLDRGAEIPAWALKGDFFSITRTADELSIICLQEYVPEGIKSSRDWRVLKMEGPFDFNLVGVMASILDPLADEGVAVLTLSTYDTDYVLVSAGQYERAVAVLAAAGHRINRV
jgi:uncharacterized protein